MGLPSDLRHDALLALTKGDVLAVLAMTHLNSAPKAATTGSLS